MSDHSCMQHELLITVQWCFYLISCVLLQQTSTGVDCYEITMVQEQPYILNIYYKVWRLAMNFLCKTGGGSGSSSQMIGRTPESPTRWKAQEMLWKHPAVSTENICRIPKFTTRHSSRWIRKAVRRKGKKSLHPKYILGRADLTFKSLWMIPEADDYTRL